MLKLRVMRRCIAILLAAVLLVPGMALAKPTSGLDLQCIADQRSVSQGGKVGIHILYHNVDNKKMSKAWAKVKIPIELEIDDAAGAEWEAGYLKWNLKDLDNNGADVIHVNLKVKAQAKSDSIELVCSGGVDTEITIPEKAVKIKLGTEIHQPVFNGYPDGGFHPGASLTRAETAAIISRLQNLTDVNQNDFYKDVPSSHWAYAYVQKVTAAGYMNGSNEMFRPDDPISRGEFVVLLLRVRGIESYPLDHFTDSKDHWAGIAASTARALRYLDGVGNDQANLDNAIEREAAAKLLCIMFLRGELIDGETNVIQHWPDVPRNRWSFGWVEELSVVAHEASSKGPFKENLLRYVSDQTEPF